MNFKWFLGQFLILGFLTYGLGHLPEKRRRKKTFVTATKKNLNITKGKKTIPFTRRNKHLEIWREKNPSFLQGEIIPRFSEEKKTPRFFKKNLFLDFPGGGNPLEKVRK